MKKILESLFDEYGDRQKSFQEENDRLSHNVAALHDTLNSHERRYLLRVRDDYDLIIEKTSEDSFYNGVNVGMKLMLEVLYCSKRRSL